MAPPHSSSPTPHESPVYAKKRVIIGDRHRSISDLLGLALTLEGNCLPVGHASLGEELLAKCRTESPDLVIIDPKLPDLPGVEVLHRVRQEHRNVRVIVYSESTSRQSILDVLETKPHGFVHRTEPLQTLYEVIRAVVGGSRYVSQYGTMMMEPGEGGDARHQPLSRQEKRVLEFIVKGVGSKQIAHEMSLSVKTIDHYRAALMKKLDIHDIAGLTRYAMSVGIIGPEG